MQARVLKASPALAIAVGALVVGLAAPAAAHEASHLISGSSIKEHTITGNRLKNNTVTGTQIKESTLGSVPKAADAEKLGNLAASGYQHATMWAYVTSLGVIGSQSGGISVVPDGNQLGIFYLDFPRSVLHSAITTGLHYDQLANNDGEIMVAPCGNSSEISSPPNGEDNCSTGANNSHELLVLTEQAAHNNSQGFYVAVTP